MIHFHALVRLDGPKTPDGFAPAPPVLDPSDLAALIGAAARDVEVPAPALFEGDPARVLRFGQQVDTKTITGARRTDDPDQSLSAEAVAGYLAKYVTKAAADLPGERPHLARLRSVIAEVAAVIQDETDPHHNAHPEDLARHPYGLLPKWTHTLAFRGHFATKSRRYSVTMGALRRARRRWQALAADAARTGQPIDTADLEARLMADDDDTTLVVGSWTCDGVGWSNAAETLLATAAAARAREYAQWKVEQRSH